VVTNVITYVDILNHSSKKNIINNLIKNHYRLLIRFTPNISLLRYFYSIDDFYLGNISSPTDISIYEKSAAK